MILEHQLGYPDVGVGELDEFALTTLFAMAQSKQLTAGRANTTADIVNKAGKGLHLGNYTTRLTVPPSLLLRSFKAWDRVAIGVRSSSYGNMLFETECVLARAGGLEDRPEGWAGSSLPTLRAGASFWLEESGREPEMSLPRADLIAELPTLAAPPESMKRFREARATGARDSGFEPNVSTRASVRYRVVSGRDSAPGHAVTCSQIVRIVDAAQRELLLDNAETPFPASVLDTLTILDSETFLVGRCYGGQTLRVDSWMRLSPWSDTRGKTADDVIPAAVLDAAAEISTIPDNELVAVCRTTKLVALSLTAQRAAKDVDRLLRSLGFGAS